MPAFFIGANLDLYKKYIHSLYKGSRDLFYSKTAFMVYELDKDNNLIIWDMYSESFKGFKKLLLKIYEIECDMVYCRISTENPKHDYIVRMYEKFGFNCYFSNDEYTNLYISNEDFKIGVKEWVM